MPQGWGIFTDFARNLSITLSTFFSSFIENSTGRTCLAEKQDNNFVYNDRTQASKAAARNSLKSPTIHEEVGNQATNQRNNDHSSVQKSLERASASGMTQDNASPVPGKRHGGKRASDLNTNES